MSRKMSDAYRGNPNIVREVTRNFTKEEIYEYTKCLRDPIYFAENYVKIINLDKGLVYFQLYPYQKTMYNEFQKNRFVIVLSCRQSGKSVSVVIYLLWYAIFHPEMTIAVLANKGSTAREILSRLKLAFEHTPHFLQPGIKTWNKGSVEFANNSKIFAAATSADSVRGQSCNLIMLDELAFVENDAKFYTSTYPVITSGTKSQVIITSTANGVGNLFHRLWSGATKAENEFKPIRVDWWDVPGRDEAWKIQTISNTSKLQFDQEFGNSFHLTGSTLISGEYLYKMKDKEPIRTEQDGSFRIYEEPVKEKKYIITVDVAEGKREDYSTFNIFDVTPNAEDPSKTIFRQIAVYQNNEISPYLYPHIVEKYAKAYNNAYILLENNTIGIVVGKVLFDDLEYENIYLESSVKADAIGVTMNKKIKKLGCLNLQNLIENKNPRIEIIDSNTISEFATFISRRNSYEAAQGYHDDLVMNFVLFAWFFSTPHFVEVVESDDVSLTELFHKDEIHALADEDTMEAELPFEGVLGTGNVKPRSNTFVQDGVVWHEIDRMQ